MNFLALSKIVEATGAAWHMVEDEEVKVFIYDRMRATVGAAYLDEYITNHERVILDRMLDRLCI